MFQEIKKIDWASLLLVSPFLVVLGSLILFPVALAVRDAFSTITFIGTEAAFAGLHQFKQVLSDSLFWTSLGRSGLWVLGNALLQTVVAFFFALVVNSRLRGGSFIQVTILLPWIVPTVAVAVTGTWLLNSRYGIVNILLQRVGIIEQPINAFGNPDIALWSLIVLNSWHWFPFFFVILLGALKTVPSALYEAAEIDGASAFRRFTGITMPLISRMLGVVGLVGTLWSFNVFDTIQLITKGGPGNSTLTAPVYVYNIAFQQFQLGKSSAASVLLMIILLIFALVFYTQVVRKAYQAR